MTFDTGWLCAAPVMTGYISTLLAHAGSDTWLLSENGERLNCNAPALD